MVNKYTKPAANAATANTIAATGPDASAENIVPSFPPKPIPSSYCFQSVKTPFPIPSVALNNRPKPDVILPTIVSTGPMAAMNRPQRSMLSLVLSFMCCNFSTKLCIPETMPLSAGFKASLICIASSCRADLRMVSCPLRLPIIVAAVVSAVPLDCSIKDATVSTILVASSFERLP